VKNNSISINKVFSCCKKSPQRTKRKKRKKMSVESEERKEKREE